jgi:uncharacterized membrane protein YbhN (UPF0104 family)
VRLAVAAAVLGVLVWRLGTGPFLAGLGQVDGWSLLLAAVLALVTTLCCAWRWSLVARGLGVAVPLRTAVAAYYRSQFLNTTLPGGVVGDVHRAVRHGRDVGDVGRGLRAVAWERSAGQVVQVALTIVVLLLMPSPLRSLLPVLLAGAALVLLVVLLLGHAAPRLGPSRWAAAVRGAVADLRDGVLATSALPGVVVASVVVVVGHATTFLVAARVAGSVAPLAQLVPLALLVLLAMSIPISVGGWGPREGAAAWAFAAAGLGAAQGLATAVVYGVMVLVASLPGAVVLVVEWLRREVPARGPQGAQPRPQVLAAADGAVHG